MSFDNRIQIFYERVLETWNDIDIFIVNCEKFQDDWGYKFPLVETCRICCNEAKREIEMMKSRLINQTLKCVMIGKVSSGKSTLLNSLILQKVLPSGFSCRTNCFIEVMKSLNERNYILIENEEKSLDLLKGLADDFSPDALPSGTHIELYYCSPQQSLLNEDVIFMDTPGFDDLSELDNSIEEKCKDGDVLILVVSSIIGLGETERKFIKDHQTVFSKPNIIILYSFWDKPQSENIDRSTKMRLRLLSQAQQFLEGELHMSHENSIDRIFFVSAEERLNAQEHPDQLVQERNDEFDKFLCFLKKNMSNNSYIRRLSIADHICTTLTKIFSEIEYCIEEMKIKEADFSNKLLEDLKILEDFNGQINAEIEIVFKDSYHQFFDKGLEIIKNEVATTEEDINEKLNYLFQELIVVTVESIKIRIQDLVDIASDDGRAHCLHILECLYFPFYFNLEKHTISFQIDVLRQSFVEINRVKKLGKGLSIGGAVVGAAATLASGGILAGVVLPIPTLFGASVLGATGAAIGGSAGGGISTALISINREAFGYFYKKDEAIMKELWKNMEDSFMNSYNDFVNEISSRIDILMVPLREQFYTLPNKINFLKSDAIRIKHSL